MNQDGSKQGKANPEKITKEGPQKRLAMVVEEAGGKAPWPLKGQVIGIGVDGARVKGGRMPGHVAVLNNRFPAPADDGVGIRKKELAQHRRQFSFIQPSSYAQWERIRPRVCSRIGGIHSSGCAESIEA